VAVGNEMGWRRVARSSTGCCLPGALLRQTLGRFAAPCLVSSAGLDSSSTVLPCFIQRVTSRSHLCSPPAGHLPHTPSCRSPKRLCHCCVSLPCAPLCCPQASHITIWTDVDGVYSADPRKVQDAVCLKQLR
jgi:hypothetical protein